MKVYFAHGKESGPWGTKIERMSQVARKLGLGVHSIDYQDLMDPDQRVERLLSLLGAEKEPWILVGSSMGAYVSLVVADQIGAAGLFLLAPALYREGYAVQEYRAEIPAEIVHGWSDEVIDYESSLRLAQQADIGLHLIPGDHRLNDSLDAVLGLFENFLRRVLAGQG